jgi:hypothetical protein
MNIYQKVNETFRYLIEAAGRIFSPTDDDYPETGVQPFEGEPKKGSHWAD